MQSTPAGAMWICLKVAVRHASQEKVKALVAPQMPFRSYMSVGNPIVDKIKTMAVHSSPRFLLPGSCLRGWAMSTSLLGSVMVRYLGEVIQIQGNQGSAWEFSGVGYKNGG